MDDNGVIDLTQSFSYCRAPIILDCSVIDLDDSTYASPRPVASLAEPIVIECETDAPPAINVTKECQTKKSTGIQKKKRPKNLVPASSSERPRSPHYGVCPICRDRLGSRPMASTNCGHVYCIHCISQAVIMEKKCPTCRKPLKGAKAFHPLFL